MLRAGPDRRSEGDRIWRWDHGAPSGLLDTGVWSRVESKAELHDEGWVGSALLNGYA